MGFLRMKVSPQGVVAIAAHEGIVPAPYKDVVGVWTYGVGHTTGAGDPDPSHMPKEMPTGGALNAAIADSIKLFADDLAKYEKRVNDAVKVPLAQHEFDALVSFDLNTGGIYKANLTKSLNKGDKASAGRQFMGWLKPEAIRGRRTAEMNLFQTGHYPETKVPVWGTNGKGRLSGIVSQISASELLSYMSEVRPIAPEPRQFKLVPDGFDFIPQLPTVDPLPSAQARAPQIPQEVLDLIDEADGDGSMTKVIMKVQEGLGGLGITLPSIFLALGDIDPIVAGSVIIVSAALFYFAWRTHKSRDDKAAKALKAKYAVKAAT